MTKHSFFLICLISCLLAPYSTIAADIPPTLNGAASQFLKHSTLAGVIRRSAKKMLLTPQKAKLIRDGVTQVVNLDELIFLSALAFGALPVLRYQYDALGFSNRADSRRSRGFEDSSLHLIFDHLGQLAKLALFIYTVDVVKVISNGMGFQVFMGNAFAKICYTCWVSNRIAAFKRYNIARNAGQDHRDLNGQAQIVDRLIDAAIYGLALYVAVDTLQAEFGAATKSVLAFGSVSTLVVSLSMQGFVAELLHGLFLAGSNRINEGDSVEVLGMKGKIENLGWLESTLRRSDVSRQRGLYKDT